MSRPSRTSGFTLIELLTVMVIILILAGIVLSIVGFAQGKAARAKAEGEIAALSNALENYKTDNGAYPRSTAYSDVLDPRKQGMPSAYSSACSTMYQALSGDIKGDGTGGYTKSYYTFPIYTTMPTDATTKVLYMLDPFGNSYGYSTGYQADLDAGTNPPKKGYNPTFDLWCTGGYGASKSYPTDLTTPATQAALWVKNW